MRTSLLKRKNESASERAKLIVLTELLLRLCM